jgi:hypothetical protein
MAVFDPRFYDPNIAVTVDPSTGLITGSPTIEQLYNGMVVPGSGFHLLQRAGPRSRLGLYNSSSAAYLITIRISNGAIFNRASELLIS